MFGISLGAKFGKKMLLGSIWLIFPVIGCGNMPGTYISKENALGLDFVDFSGDWLWAISLGPIFRRKNALGLDFGAFSGDWLWAISLGPLFRRKMLWGYISLIFWRLAVGKRPGAYISKENALGLDVVDFSGVWLWAIGVGPTFQGTFSRPRFR